MNTAAGQLKVRQNLYQDALRVGFPEAKARQIAGLTAAQTSAPAAAAGTVSTLSGTNGHPPGVIYASGCAKIDSSYLYWRGCYRRYGTRDDDPNARYSAEDTQASGNGKPGSYLYRGKTGTRYGHSNLSTSTLVKWSPGLDRTTSKCYTYTVGGTLYGLSLSIPIEVCPQKHNVEHGDWWHYNKWEGAVTGTGQTVEAGQATWARVPNGKMSGFNYNLEASWIPIH